MIDMWNNTLYSEFHSLSSIHECERILLFTCIKDRNERYLLNYLHKTLEDISLNIDMCTLYGIFLQKLESAINTICLLCI